MSLFRRSLRRRSRLLRLGVVLLLVLLLIDGLTALQTGQIQAALTLGEPPPQRNAPMSAAEPVNGAQAVLAGDTFRRADQAYWGMSSSGQNWLEDAQTDVNFAVSHAHGLVKTAAGCVFCQALLGPVVSDAEVSFTAALSLYSPSALCAILRWNDANNFYKLVLDGRTLTLWRVMDGMAMPLQSLAFPARNGAMYTFRFRATGSQLFALVWPADQPQPADWQIAAQDSALTNGRAGIGILVQNGAQATFTTFREVAV